MADKTIGSLPKAPVVNDESLFVIEQDSTAMSATGAQWKGYAQQAVSQYVDSAQESAQQAQKAAQDAIAASEGIGDAVANAEQYANEAKLAKESAEQSKNSAESAATVANQAKSDAELSKQSAEESKTAAAQSETNALSAKTEAETARDNALQAQTGAQESKNAAETAAQTANEAKGAAETAKVGAEAARKAIEDMMVEAITLATGEPASVSKQLVDDVVKLVFGLPTGAKGDPGNNIRSIDRTSGTGAPGTTDTYTVTLTDGSVGGTFQVYNGANGEGAGDMLTSVYDPTGRNTDIFAYVDEAVTDIPADDVKFTDGETFQQKFDSGELRGQDGTPGQNGADGKPGADGEPGEDGGYYTPAVDSEGNITFTASKAGMPPVSGANIRGPQGIPGQDGGPGPAGADGATGPQGDPGPPGVDGKSPYQVAVEEGYTGSQTDFNDALVNLGNISGVLDSINGEVI